MSDTVFFHHRPDSPVLTVGQLREALAQFDADLPVHLSCVEEPGGQFEDTVRVVTGAVASPVYDHHDQPTDAIEAVVLSGDWPEGEYNLPRYPTRELERRYHDHYRHRFGDVD